MPIAKLKVRRSYVHRCTFSESGIRAGHSRQRDHVLYGQKWLLFGLVAIHMYCTHGGNSILTRTLGQLSIFRSICFVFVAKLNSCNVPSSVPENADRMPDDFGSRIFFVSISGEPLKKLLISGTFPPNRLNHLNPFPTSVEDPYPIISELIDWIRIPSKTRFRLLKTVSKNDLTNFRI